MIRIEYLAITAIILVFTVMYTRFNSYTRKSMEPFIVGIKGKIFPLEKLIECNKRVIVKDRIDPLHLEEKCTGRRLSLGFTLNYFIISSSLLVAPLITYVLSNDVISAVLLLSFLVALNMSLRSWRHSIRVHGNIAGPDTEGYYEVHIKVASWPGSRIIIVDEPPPGDVVGTTIIEGKGVVNLRYSWKPVAPGKYSWKPRLVLVEDPVEFVRLDLSNKILLSVNVPQITMLREVSLGIISRSTSREESRTIREPVIDHVRPYAPGDSLRDIVPKSIVSPAGLAVKEYESLYEEVGKPKARGLPAIVLGELSTQSTSMLRNIITHALRYVVDEVVVIVEPWGKIFRVDKDLLSYMLVNGISVLREATAVDNVDKLGKFTVAFIDPSVHQLPNADNIVVVLPFDWRILFLESYKHGWMKYKDMVAEVYRNAKIVW